MEKIGGGESGASSGDVLSGDAASAGGGAGEMMFPKGGSTEQVQEWFKLGNFSKYASFFEEFNGPEAFGLTESQIQTGISNQLRGSALFNAIHKHDRAATTGTAATGVAAVETLLSAVSLAEKENANHELNKQLAAPLSPTTLDTNHIFHEVGPFEAFGTAFAAETVLHVSDGIYLEVQAVAAGMMKHFKRSGQLGGTHIKDALLAACLKPPSRINESSENLVVSFVDNITRHVFEELGAATITDDVPFNTQVTRNVGGNTAQSPPESVKKHSTATPVQGHKRLDMYVVEMTTRLLVFFGEEESEESDEHAEAQLQDPARIVYSAANFGTAPFVVVYVCRGTKLQFFSFSRMEIDSDKPKVQRLWVPFDLTKCVDRLRVIFHLIFIFKWLRSMVRVHFPSEPMPVDKHVRVELDVLKKEVVGIDETRRQELASLHKLLEQDDVPQSLVRAHIADATMVRAKDGFRPLVKDASCCITLWPVGYHCLPTNAEEGKSFFCDILHALDWLHTVAKWVHRDIRLPNVVRTASVDKASTARTKGCWMLIDYEMAAPLSCGWPTDLKSEFQPKSETEANGLWEPRHDLWQFFHLVVHGLRNVSTNNGLQQLCDTIRSKSSALNTAKEVSTLIHSLDTH